MSLPELEIMMLPRNFSVAFSAPSVAGDAIPDDLRNVGKSWNKDSRARVEMVRLSVIGGRRWQVQWCLRAAAGKIEGKDAEFEYWRCGSHDELVVVLLALIVEGRSGLGMMGRHCDCTSETPSGAEKVC